MIPQTRALISPQMDFWLLGGLSAVVLAIIWVLTEWLHIELMRDLPWWLFCASFVVNYPHFAYSYQVFYHSFWKRLKTPESTAWSHMRLCVAGIIAPAAIIGYLYMSFALKDPWLLATGVSVMLFLVGWHYVKQGYGVLITISIYKGIYMDNWQKRLLYIHAYAAWIFSWTRVNTTARMSEFHDVRYYALDLPPWLLDLATWGITATGIAAAAGVLWCWLVQRRGIALNGLIGYLSSIYVWVAVPFYNTAFFYCIPFFHSLQYLPFIYKYKKTETERDRAGKDTKEAAMLYWSMVAFVVTGIALGAIFMDLLPKHLDYGFSLYDKGSFTKNYFLVSFLLFINIHHYFIDNAFWRRDNKDVQDYLFRA